MSNTNLMTSSNNASIASCLFSSENTPAILHFVEFLIGSGVVIYGIHKKYSIKMRHGDNEVDFECINN